MDLLAGITRCANVALTLVLVLIGFEMLRTVLMIVLLRSMFRKPHVCDTPAPQTTEWL